MLRMLAFKFQLQAIFDSIEFPKEKVALVRRTPLEMLLKYNIILTPYA